MSDRIKKSWTVLQSIETPTGDYCVDIFTREDGSFGYEEFRRDIEDQGRWTGINYYSQLSFGTQDEAISSARDNVAWFNQHLDENC